MTQVPPSSHVSDLLKTSVTLTNTQLKTLRATPVTLVAPSDANHAVLPLRMGFVLDDSHGIYTDADGIASASIGYMPTPTAGVNTTTFGFDDVTMGNPGPGVYPTTIAVTFAWGLLESGGVAPSGAVGVGKLGAAEYAGGGAGNFLVVDVWYLEVRLT